MASVSSLILQLFLASSVFLSAFLYFFGSIELQVLSLFLEGRPSALLHSPGNCGPWSGLLAWFLTCLLAWFLHMALASMSHLNHSLATQKELLSTPQPQT